MYFFCNHYIRPRPYCYVETQQDCGAHAGGEEDVEEGECHGGEHYGDHSHTLAHADGKELVVDVVLVGEEGVAAVAHTVEIYPHHIKARHEQRGERQDEGVDMVGRPAMRMLRKQSMMPMVRLPVSPMNILRPFSALPNTL